MLERRLRMVREALGYNQRDMAKRVGVTGPAWQHYETGQNMPGGAVLTALAKAGIDLHWLLLGDGAMLRGDAGRGETGRLEVGRSPGDLSQEAAFQQWLLECGLPEIFALGALSRVADVSVVQGVLNLRYPRELTTEELLEALKQQGAEAEASQLSALLYVLLRQGTAVEVAGTPKRFRARSSGEALVVRDISGHARFLLRCVKTLALDMLPRAGGIHGCLCHMGMSVQAAQAPALVERLKAVVRDTCRESANDGVEDNFTVVLGVAHLETLSSGKSAVGGGQAKMMADRSREPLTLTEG